MGEESRPELKNWPERISSSILSFCDVCLLDANVRGCREDEMETYHDREGDGGN